MIINRLHLIRRYNIMLIAYHFTNARPDLISNRKLSLATISMYEDVVTKNTIACSCVISYSVNHFIYVNFLMIL